MNTLQFIYNKYNLSKKPEIILHVTRSGTFPTLFKQLGFTVGAEIGVAQGYFSKHLLNNTPNLKLYSIDPYVVFSGCTHGETQTGMDNSYKIAKKKLSGLNSIFMKEKSMDIVKRFADESLDFVYIDAAHDYQSTYEDIREWSKKVKKGGIIAGHDYSDPIADRSLGYYKEVFDVKHAVNDWVKQNKIEPLFIFVKNNDTSWFYVKK